MVSNLQNNLINREAFYGAKNYSPLPIVLQKGEGVYLWDVDGNKYLDMMSAYSAVSHGHSHPELVKVLANQAEKLAISSRAFYTEPFGEYIEKLSPVYGQAGTIIVFDTDCIHHQGIVLNGDCRIIRSHFR